MSDLFDYKKEMSALRFTEEQKKLLAKAVARNAEMTEQGVLKGRRKMIATALAACLAVALASTAYAANFLGIREMWQRPDRQLPEAAAGLIEQHNESGAAEGWNASVTESLCDASTVMVTVTVSGGERYIVAPTDAEPDDPVSAIGLDGSETLGGYATKQGKTLLLVGANLPFEQLGGAGQSQTFRSTSDSEMAILIQAEKTLTEPSISTSCTVYAREAGGGDVQRVEIPLTLAQADAGEIKFSPIDPEAVPGLRIGEATVTETPLGVNVRFPVLAADNVVLGNIMKMDCDEIANQEGGGFVLGEDDIYYVQWTMGQGSVADTLHVHFYDWNGELVGSIVFQKLNSGVVYEIPHN